MNKPRILGGGIILAVAVVLMFSPPASARVQDGLDLVVESMETPAKSGQLFTARLRIMTDRLLQITEFSIEGDQWSNLTWTPVRGAKLSPDAPLTVEFSGTPGRADASLTIIVRSDHKAIRRTLTLGGEEFERRTGPLPTKMAEIDPPQPWISQRALAKPVQPAPPRLDPDIDDSIDDQEGAAPTEKSAQDRTIRIVGRFMYLREGATLMGADGMTVHAYDDDPVVDDHLGTSFTDYEAAWGVASWYYTVRAEDDSTGGAGPAGVWHGCSRRRL